MTGRLLLVAAGVHDLAGTRALPRALLLQRDRIVWSGAEPAAAPPHERASDLGAAWITPAFVDAHVHATATGLAASGVELAGARSAADLVARVQRHAEQTHEPVIMGAGWDDFAWPEGRLPTAQELSRAAPGRVVHLTRVDAHSCLVDAGTLAQLPLADLAGVARTADGAPTGLLQEDAAQAALAVTRAALTARQLHAARRRACTDAAALGIGSLHEMGHPGMFGLDDALAWAHGSWPLDVLVWWAELDPTPPAPLRPGGDLFLDGSIGSGTAAVRVPYRDGGGTGTLFHADDDVAAFFTETTTHGRGAGVHAIGDRAVEQAAGALEAAARTHGEEAVRACRHRVEHLVLATRTHVRRLARLGAVASMQPAFDAAWGGPTGLYASRLGPKRSLTSNPFAWCAAEPAALAFSSDSTVTPLAPWGGVLAAEQHRGGLGITRTAAFAAHTVGGRFAACQDDVGPLAPGRRADLAVWDRDPLALEDPRDARCLATIVRGQVVHGTLMT